jgi:hypothetical protein
MMRGRHHVLDPVVAPRAPSTRRELLCLVPGVGGFIGYTLYPAAVRGIVAPGWIASLDAWPVIEHGDVFLLIAGIVTSAVCWFYSEPRAL